MVIRRDKKLKKYLGTRSRGAGNTKNRRGAGCKGGKGRAGSKKHKFQKYVKLFGTEKIKPRQKKIENTISLFTIK